VGHNLLSHPFIVNQTAVPTATNKKRKINTTENIYTNMISQFMAITAQKGDDNIRNG